MTTKLFSNFPVDISRVYDVLGNEVKKIIVISKSQAIDISQYSPGIYYASIPYVQVIIRKSNDYFFARQSRQQFPLSLQVPSN